MTDFMIIIGAFGSLFILLGIPCLAMSVSLLKQGDERRKMILEKTCTQTFVVYILVNVINILGKAFTDFETFHDQTNDVVQLAVISMVFCIHLLFNKKKYGD